MLTPLELDIMKAVWHRAPATVREVQIALRPARPLAYTTVMTVMNRLYHKGFLTRRLKSRAHLYEAAVPHSRVRDAAVTLLIENFFEGSKDLLQEYLNGAEARPTEDSATFLPPTIDETLL